MYYYVCFNLLALKEMKTLFCHVYGIKFMFLKFDMLKCINKNKILIDFANFNAY